jgi:hypothetical protein
MDPDPNPAIFDIDLHDANKELIQKKVFLLIEESGSEARVLLPILPPVECYGKSFDTDTRAFCNFYPAQ